jgi:hypothetical protein
MKPEGVAEQVIYKFVKKIHDDECQRLNKNKLTDEEIEKLTSKFYTEKEKSLRKNITSAIKKICEPDAQNNIDNLLNKLFENPNLNQKKIIQEIKLKQNL